MTIQARPGRAPKPLPIHGPANTSATITEPDSHQPGQAARDDGETGHDESA